MSPPGSRHASLVVFASSLLNLVALTGCGDDSASRPGRMDGGRAMDGAVFCPDADDDTICDADEGDADIDGDGIPASMDPDTDGDGLTDRAEAGDLDPSTSPRDSNGDRVPDYLDPDFPRARDGGALAPPPDAGGLDGSGIYDMDSGHVVADLCPATRLRPTACAGPILEVASGLCDGLDNDCDGDVDEGCPCMPGDVQRCFRGPPGRHGVGACEDGRQLCAVSGEFGVWGTCEGGITPSPETCDDLDNDCNGCTDEVEGCVPTGSCPAPGDARIPDGRPFSTYTLRGADFYMSADATAWLWNVTGTPCDQMFLSIAGSTASPTNGQLSFRLDGADRQDASIDFTLSGDYRVTLDVTRSDGTHFTCTWIVHVRAPGMRVELCWDATGPTASTFGGTVDVDLHLGKTGTTGRWFDPTDCDYSTCQGDWGAGPGWGYADTPLASCTGPGSRGGFTGSCPNPRLDIDNIAESTSYVPENTNIDNPNDGDRFRVMVHHYASVTRETRPLVNVYCGGELYGTYGATPDVVTGFDRGGGRAHGDMWRVVDVTTHVAAGGTTTGCDLAPVFAPGAMSGYYVTTDDPTY